LSACDSHLWIRQAAAAIHEGFVNYNNNFRRITQRARSRFETRDWSGARNDLSERIELYEKSVSRTLGTLRKQFPEQADLLPQ
jgi:isocitrate dehydrogenase kinase/phosphatase